MQGLTACCVNQLPEIDLVRVQGKQGKENPNSSSRLLVTFMFPVLYLFHRNRCVLHDQIEPNHSFSTGRV